jgi:autotransporter-associated beta strand protein
MSSSLKLSALTLLAFVMVTLGAPRPAEAQVYIWKNVDGSWDNPNNWEPFGFPNAPGDQAFFSQDYSGKRTVTIPDGAIITIGTIFFTDDAITIAPIGSGRLRLDNGIFVPTITRIGAPPLDSDVISAPIELRNNAEINVDAGAGFIINNTISNSLGAWGITKKGRGILRLRAGNSYLGTTSVERGQLLLDMSNNVVIQGNLEIGTGAAGDVIAEVLVTKANQISDASRVLVKSQGLLTVDIAEQVGDVIVNDGFITIRNSVGALVPASLTLSGGIVESRTGANILLEGPLTATSSAKGPARIFRSGTDGELLLGGTSRTFTINDGPSTAHDLTIDLPIMLLGQAGLNKQGLGTLRLTASNNYAGLTTVRAGNLWLEPPAGGQSIAGGLIVGGFAQPASVDVRRPGAIADTSPVSVTTLGQLWINTTTPEVIGTLTVFNTGTVLVGNFTNGARLVTPALSMQGGRVLTFFDNNTLEVTTTLRAFSEDQETATISGGNLVLGGERKFEVLDGPAAVDFRVSAKILGGAADGLQIVGPGVTVLEGTNSYRGPTIIGSTVLINGQQPESPITVVRGTLGGVGTVGSIGVSTTGMGDPIVAPGQSPGQLSSGSIAFTSATTFHIELNGTNFGEFDQLAVTGTVGLNDARLQITAPPTLSRNGSFTIIDNDGTDPVVGTFFQRPEGSRIEIGSHEYQITYRGGDGNDVVIESLAPLTYYLAEGATGDFFDDDVLIANPNNVEATATLTFLREGGATVVVQRVIPARARITVHVEEIAGLENASASVEVKTDPRLPLIVERTMFWDASYYGGHTANAVARPERQWIFAEGFQGFFDTYILIANANDAATTATLTFLRENDTPVVKTVNVDPFARKTVYAGDYEELQGRAFGIVVDATEPVIAERAMYFATQPGKLWAGGHVNTGIIAPSTSWFHAEGATGTFFNTFILLSNPQTTEAKVDVRFLLDNGTVITRPKTLAPQQRLTINPATEGDSRLENAALSTVVLSDVPIVSERSMYWEGDVVRGLGEGHNSSGVVQTGERWGLAEGRLGGAHNFDTYILLANPSDAAARVRVTYLRDNGAPIVKEYDVPATSRFNIDVKTVVPELANSSFGADIEVLNQVLIAVERSLYWDANGAFWAGGTNALATPLPPVP